MKYLKYALIALMLIGCGKKDKGTNNPIIGSFGPSQCFKNTLATAGIGIDIWTISSIRFDMGGVGSIDFELFDDAACTNSLLSGTNVMNWTILDSSILKMVQAPGTPDEQTLYFVYSFISNGYGLTPSDLIIDANNSGPYTTFDDALNARSSFFTNITSKGVLIPRK